MTEDRTPQTDAIVLIYTRNEFYRNKYQWVLGVCVLGFILIVALVGMLLYITRHPLQPLYFVTDKAGRLMQEIPVTRPNMSTEDVAKWAVEAVIAANTYDYVNFHGQLQAAQKYFTDYGWRNYMNGLQASNNLLALTQRKLIFLAQQAGPVKLDAEGPVGKAGIYGWKFEIPMLITYLLPPYDGVSQKSKFENAYIFSVLIERQSILTSYKGLGIMQIIGSSASNSSQETLSAPT
jgi:intracellular multiplication protein IcmL